MSGFYAIQNVSYNDSATILVNATNATSATKPQKSGFGGDLSIIFNEATAIGALTVVSLVVVAIIARASWLCHKSKQANETYWDRVQHVKRVSEKGATARYTRKIIATSWENPLSRTWNAAPQYSAQVPEAELEPVSENKARWQLSLLVAPTLTRVAIENAARRIQSSDEALARENQAKFIKTMRKSMAAAKIPKYMLTTVGNANRTEIETAGEGIAVQTMSKLGAFPADESSAAGAVPGGKGGRGANGRAAVPRLNGASTTVAQSGPGRPSSARDSRLSGTTDDDDDEEDVVVVLRDSREERQRHTGRLDTVRESRDGRGTRDWTDGREGDDGDDDGDDRRGGYATDEEGEGYETGRQRHRDGVGRGGHRHEHGHGHGHGRDDVEHGGRGHRRSAGGHGHVYDRTGSGDEGEGTDVHADASSEEAVPDGWSWREEQDGAVVWIDPQGRETDKDPRDMPEHDRRRKR